MKIKYTIIELGSLKIMKSLTVMLHYSEYRPQGITYVDLCNAVQTSTDRHIQVFTERGIHTLILGTVDNI
jgi:hypothetical protein